MSSVKLHIFTYLMNRYIKDYTKLLFPFEKDIQEVCSPFRCLKDPNSFMPVLNVIMEHFLKLKRFSNFVIYSPEEEEEKNLCILTLFIPHYSSSDYNALIHFYNHTEDYCEKYYKYKIYKVACLGCFLSKRMCLFDTFEIFLIHLNQEHKPVQPESTRSILLGGSRKHLQDLKRTFTEYVETLLKLLHTIEHKNDFQNLIAEQLNNYELMFYELDNTIEPHPKYFLQFELLDDLLSVYKS